MAPRTKPIIIFALTSQGNSTRRRNSLRPLVVAEKKSVAELFKDGTRTQMNLLPRSIPAGTHIVSRAERGREDPWANPPRNNSLFWFKSPSLARGRSLSTWDVCPRNRNFVCRFCQYVPLLSMPRGLCARMQNNRTIPNGISTAGARIGQAELA